VTDFIVLGVLFIALTIIALSPKGMKPAKARELIEKKKEVLFLESQK